MNKSLKREYEFGVQILIVASLIAFSIETLPDLSDRTKYVLEWVECICVCAFTIEYIARLWVAERRLEFIFSFFGIVDLLAILPFYLSTSVDLRSARAVRLLRLFRILKLARYNAAVRRFHAALVLAKEEIVLFMTLTAIVLYLAAVGIYHFEHDAQPEHFKSVFHSLWWAITTLTTVGYGDMYPVTVGGRMFTFVILIVGLGIVSVPAGLVSAALLRARSLESDDAAVSEQIRAMNEQSLDDEISA